MGETSGQNLDVAALLVLVPVVCVLVVVGLVVLRRRRLDPNRRMAKGPKIRLDVMRRDLDRPAEYMGALFESEPPIKLPFEQGLAATAAYQWDQAIRFFQKAQEQAGWQHLIPLLNQSGVCCYMRGRLDEALKNFEESARLADQHGDQQGKVSALGNIGVVHRENGDLGTALRQLKEALAMARTLDDQRAVSIHLGNLGSTYHDRGEIDNALTSHENALAISLRIGDKQGVVSGLGNIGSIHRDKGDLGKALERYAEALDTANKDGYKLGAAFSLGNIGGIYREQGDLDKALNFHEQALELGREVGYQMGVATELGNIGLILVNEKKYEQAVPKLGESLAILLAAGAARGPLQALYGLSMCDDKLGRDRMHELLKQAGLADASTADVLDRVDQIRTRRPRQRGRGRVPFAPAA